MGASTQVPDFKVGILALQGAVREHVGVFSRLGVEAVAVTDQATLEAVDALVLPGGESTAISRLLETSGLLEPVRRRVKDKIPTFGTCAGMILLARTVSDGRPDQHQLDGIDIDVRRNAFGRQVDSFETDLVVDGLPAESRTRTSGRASGRASGAFHAVFIRAPLVERVGPRVEVLASVEGSDGVRRAVLCREGSCLVSAFHPELSRDLRLHEMFLESALDSHVKVPASTASRSKQ